MEHNLATPLGTASIVGFGGQALDLGMGFLSRSFGFLIDNIIDYGEFEIKVVMWSLQICLSKALLTLLRI